MWSDAESIARLEREEGPALREVFGRGSVRVALVAPVMGDWRGASSALQAAAGVGFLAARRLPRTAAFPGRMDDGDASPADGGRPPRTIIVSAFDRLGVSAALVLSLPPEVLAGGRRA